MAGPIDFGLAAIAASGNRQDVTVATPLPVTSGPSRNAAAVTPADGANLANPAMALYVGGAGNVKVDTVGGQTGVTFTGVTAGSVLPIQVTKVYATGTTATTIVALY